MPERFEDDEEKVYLSEATDEAWHRLVKLKLEPRFMYFDRNKGQMTVVVVIEDLKKLKRRHRYAMAAILRETDADFRFEEGGSPLKQLVEDLMDEE